MSEDKKLEAYEFGIFAENIVAEEYLKNGYTILEKRWKMGHTEIDLIAQKDDVVILIEVKARKDKEGDPLGAVTTDKRKRMVRAADSYLRRLKGSYDYRFDIATVTGNNKEFSLEIYKDAFLAVDLY